MEPPLRSGGDSARVPGAAILSGGRLAAQWDSYRLLVVPAEAPANQVTECRRAFYAGAEAMRRVLLAIGDGPTEDELAECDKVDAELRDFCRSVLRGEG